MRSLQTDRGIPALIWLTVALVLFLLWIAWFFWAPITRYETGTIVGTTRDGRLVAEFPSRAYEAIWQGQAAYIRPYASDNAQTAGSAPASLQNTAVAIPAVVANILGPPNEHYFRVSLSIQPDAQTTVLFQQIIPSEVAVEVAQLSPAKLVARASGQLVDSPSLSLSPQ